MQNTKASDGSPAQAPVPAWSDAVVCALGVSPEQARRLLRGDPIASSSGLQYQLHIHQSNEDVQGVHPAVRLPLKVNELVGDEITRMLALQAMLLFQGAWFLTVADDNMLQLASMPSSSQAAEIVAVLEDGDLLAWGIVRALTGDDEAYLAAIDSGDSNRGTHGPVR